MEQFTMFDEGARAPVMVFTKFHGTSELLCFQQPNSVDNSRWLAFNQEP